VNHLVDRESQGQQILAVLSGGDTHLRQRDTAAGRAANQFASFRLGRLIGAESANQLVEKQGNAVLPLRVGCRPARTIANFHPAARCQLVAIVRQKIVHHKNAHLPFSPRNPKPLCNLHIYPMLHQLTRVSSYSW
jgi:hypothetical protein